MVFPFLLLFVGLLLAYMVTASWAGTDPRYLVAFGLAVLVGSATAAAGFGYTSAVTLAEFAPFLLLGGMILMIIDDRRRPTTAPNQAAGK